MQEGFQPLNSFGVPLAHGEKSNSRSRYKFHPEGTISHLKAFDELAQLGMALQSNYLTYEPAIDPYSLILIRNIPTNPEFKLVRHELISFQHP